MSEVRWEIEHWHNGQKKLEILWVDGQRYGLETLWHPNGQKWHEIPWVNGELHGLETSWYENGQKWHETPWVNWQNHGLETWWYPDGSLLSIAKWEQGQKQVAFEFPQRAAPEGKRIEVNLFTNTFELI